LDKIEKNKESLKKAQQDKIEYNAGSVLLNLFMDGIGKFKLPYTPPCTLSRIRNFEFRNIRRCVYTAVIMEPAM
jgi:hypothetical protein